MNNLRGTKAEITANLRIIRAGTGKIEDYTLKLTPQLPEESSDGRDTLDSSTERSNELSGGPA